MQRKGFEDKYIMAKKNDIAKAEVAAIQSVEQIESLILTIRGKQVILDRDLARLYGVETKVLNQAVKRNIERFPEDFLFQLTKEEYGILKSQIAIANAEYLRSQNVTIENEEDFLRSQNVTIDMRGRHLKYLPYAFTENGIAMLSLDCEKHNAQYAPIEVKQFDRAHDRFLCVDDTVYLIGASLKDLGKKWFGFVKLEQPTDQLLSKM